MLIFTESHSLSPKSGQKDEDGIEASNLRCIADGEDEAVISTLLAWLARSIAADLQ